MDEKQIAIIAIVVLAVIPLIIFAIFASRKKSVVPGSPAIIRPGMPGVVPGSPGMLPGSPGMLPGSPGMLPGSPGMPPSPGLPVTPPGMLPPAPGVVPGQLPNPVQPPNAPPSGVVIDPTNPPQPVDTKSVPGPTEIGFETKVVCQSKRGAINWVNDAKLLTCDNIIPFGQPESPIFREMDRVQAMVDNGTFKPANEKEKLALYFKIVYPSSDPKKWDAMTEAQLVDYYQHLELYYSMPAAIMPTTPITRRRTADKQFYRVPNGVILDQDPDRLGESGTYLEVIRFGPMYNFFTDPTLFLGTYYYPAKGSGLYLPLGRTLVAYNKVHAMKLLGAQDAQIVLYGGRDFQSFLRKDSADPKYSSEQPVSVCVVNKKGTANDPGCNNIFNYFTSVVKYKPGALKVMIQEMVSGKCLRQETRMVEAGKPSRKTLVYYGCGDTGDKFLAQMARNRGYNTVQCLREAQMELNGDAVVGNELIHLVENVYSQTALLRLDPFKIPFYMPPGAAPEIPINYLIEKSVEGVSSKAVISSEFQPFRQKVFDINVIVEER